MDLNSIYQYAEQNSIDIFEFPTHNKKAFCIDDNQNQFIAIDYTKIESDIEEKEILAEEISHLKYKLLYFLSDYHNPNFMSNVRKTEKRAKRRAAELLIPLSELKQALEKTKEIWELAEIFETSEEMIKIAIDSYQQKNLFKNELANLS